MKQYSPTSLGILDKNCPAALEFYLQKRQSTLLNDTEYEVEGPEMAEIGIVFHACVYAAAHARKKDEPPWNAIEATAVALSTKMHPGRVLIGKNMAIEFAKWWEFPTVLDFEHGVAFDPQWRQVEWDSPARRVRLIFDACGVETVEDEVYGEITIARAQDYKTGWGVNEDELNSIQQDLYSTALRKMYPEVDGIKLEVIATRFSRVYSKLYIFGEEDHEEELRVRKSNVEFWLKAGDASDGKARVGPGCMRCNFTSQCSAFQDRAKNVLATPDIARDPAEVARDFAVIKTREKELEAFLKEAVQVQPIEINNQTLGYHPKDKREVKSHLAALELWLKANGATLPDELESVMKGLFAVLEPGVTQVERVIKKTAPLLGYRTQKAALEAEGEKHIETRTETQFGWKKSQERKGQEK